MDPRTALKLVERIQALERKTPTIRLGTVTDTAPLAVALGGSDTPYTNVKALDGDALAADDVIAAVMFGRDLLILGRISDGQPESWHDIGAGGEPAFANSWTNYGGAYAPAGFYKDPGGLVHLRGAVKSGSSPSATVFTLPAGYLPSHTVVQPSVASGGTLAAIEITSAGVVAASTGGSATFMALDGITFRAET